MRILKPEVAKQRKEKILRWVVQQYVETRRPVGSQLLADSALPDVSSATIRNILKELEDEGFLYQPHTSGGRIPTDKAYRYYVDYLTGDFLTGLNRVEHYNTDIDGTYIFKFTNDGILDLSYSGTFHNDSDNRLYFIFLGSSIKRALLLAS